MNITHCKYETWMTTEYKSIREHDLAYHRSEQNDLKVQEDKKQSPINLVCPTLCCLITMSSDFLSSTVTMKHHSTNSLKLSLQRYK